MPAKGADLDDIFAYETIKVGPGARRPPLFARTKTLALLSGRCFVQVVIIKDSRVGMIHRGIQGVIATFVIGFVRIIHRVEYTIPLTPLYIAHCCF